MVPTLADQLNKYKSGGSLLETSTEETQKLAKQAGLPASPISAVGVGQLGGTPQQQAMAGTEAQKSKALEQAVAPAKSLQTVQRTQQVQAQDPSEVAKQRAADLEKMGSLGSRVNELINSKVLGQAQTGQAAIQVRPDLDLSQFKLAEGITPDTVKAKLAEFGPNPDPAKLVEINKMLGTEANPLTAGDVQNFFTGDVGGTLAQLTPDKIMMDEGTVAQLNLGLDSGQLASLLNVSPEELKGKSLADVQQLVKQEQAKDLSNVGNLQSKLSDPNVGDAEKDQVRAQLASMSAGGVTGLEAEAARNVGQIQKADQVSIGGETFNASELLSDKGVSELVSRYLSTDELNKEFRDKIKSENPELAGWIEQNKTNIEKQVAAVGGSAEKLADIQESNLAVASTPTGQRLDDNVMKAVFPEWGQLTATQYDPNSVPFLQVINDPNNPAPQKLTDALNDVAKTNPDILAEMKDLSKEDLTKLGMNDPNSPTWPNYLKYKQDSAQLAKIPDNDIDKLLDFTFGRDVSPSDVSSQLSTLSTYAKITGTSNSSVQGLMAALDKNNDGRIDDPASIKAALSSMMSGGNLSLKDVLAGSNAVSASGSFGGLDQYSLSAAMQKATQDEKLAPIMKHMKNGVLTDIKEKDLKGLSFKDLNKLYSNFKSDETISMDKDSKYRVQDALRLRAQDEAFDHMDKKLGIKNSEDVVRTLWQMEGGKKLTDYDVKKLGFNSFQDMWGVLKDMNSKLKTLYNPDKLDKNDERRKFFDNWHDNVFNKFYYKYIQ